MLFILDRNLNVVETLSNVGDLSKIIPYYDDVYTQDLPTGAETFEFTTAANTRKAQHLNVGNYIAFKDDKDYKLFNIISIDETHDQNFEKTVYCEMAGIELINTVVRPMEVNNCNLRKLMETILELTDWQIGKMDASFTEIIDFKISQELP